MDEVLKKFADLLAEGAAILAFNEKFKASEAGAVSVAVPFMQFARILRDVNPGNTEYEPLWEKVRRAAIEASPPKQVKRIRKVFPTFNEMGSSYSQPSPHCLSWCWSDLLSWEADYQLTFRFVELAAPFVQPELAFVKRFLLNVLPSRNMYPISVSNDVLNIVPFFVLGGASDAVVSKVINLAEDKRFVEFAIRLVKDPETVAEL